MHVSNSYPVYNNTFHALPWHTRACANMRAHTTTHKHNHSVTSCISPPAPSAVMHTRAHTHTQTHTYRNQTCKQTRAEHSAVALPLCISLPHPLCPLPLDTTQTLPVGKQGVRRGRTWVTHLPKPHEFESSCTC